MCPCAGENTCLLLHPILHLVVVEMFRRCQLHPELSPHPEDCQDYAHDGHEERQLDLVTQHNNFNIKYLLEKHVQNTEFKSY